MQLHRVTIPWAEARTSDGDASRALVPHSTKHAPPITVRKSTIGETSPTSAIVSCIERLVKHYDDGVQTHEKPLEEAKNALENCEWVYNQM